MNKLMVLFSVFTLSACNPHGIDKAKAEFLCKGHGGLYVVNTELFVQAYCNDGTRLSARQISSTTITDANYYAKNESK